jgi:acetylornithine deacetylase/succinyl-diaminopimelate desuccinylase-like protein
MSDRAVQAIDAYLQRERTSQTRFLAELVKVPSDNPPGNCAGIAERVAALLEGLGYEVERHPVPPELARAHDMGSVTNLVVRERFGIGPTIALNAHGDVVPPGLGWTTDPYGAEIRDGTMYGRGVAVSKSDFATYAYALCALKASAAPLRGTVELHFTFDEETGGALGPAWLLAQHIVKPDYAISAGFAYGITTAHNGCLHLEVEIIGQSAHAARPETGIDALEAATGVLSELYAIRKTYAATRSSIRGIDSPTLTVGLVSGGVNTNVVPDNVTFRLDRRIIPEEDPAQVEATLIRQIHDAAAKWRGVRCNVRRILLAVPFIPMRGQDELVAALARHATPIMGERVEPHGVPIYTDARLYSTAGIPTVLYGAGPHTLLEANGHRADERLVLEDLYKATRVVALALADLLAPSNQRDRLAR